MKTIYYRQCGLERNRPDGNKEYMITWLPEKYAVAGKYLKLKTNETEKWVDGWMVQSVGDSRREEAEAIERSRDFKRQRAASDI